jgi:hypothetical protein
MAKPANRAGGAETPQNAAKFTMARDGLRRRFHGALIGTYKRLILGANLAVSDFRDWLLHGCTGSRYKFRRNERRNRLRCAEQLGHAGRRGQIRSTRVSF